MATAARQTIMKPATRNRQKRSTSDGITRLLAEAHSSFDERKFEVASELYQRVLQSQPDNIIALHGLGLIALENAMPDVALELFGHALEFEPSNAAINKGLALAMTRLGRHVEAIKVYEMLAQREPDNGEVSGELARLLLLTGKPRDALTHFICAFRQNPDDPRNLHGLFQLDCASIDDSVIAQVEMMLENPRMPLEDRSSFYFALGSIHDKAGRYDEAFANYTVANMAKASKYDAREHETTVSGIIDNFTPDLFRKPEHAGNDSAQPVFIIGMPRSGTTLVEQILSTHPQVFAAGELDRIEKLANGLCPGVDSSNRYPDGTRGLERETLRQAAADYLEYIRGLGGENASRLIDKMPVNFFYLGLIALLFPRAHIIHCRRHPLDVCLSCYFQNFAGNHAYANDLNNLAHYYQQYARLMAHWKKVLPVRFYTLDYERLVEQPEKITRELFSYLELDWNADCLDFYRGERLVKTASVAQVRQPLYRQSVDRWRHYEKYLTTLKNILCAPGSTSEGSCVPMDYVQNRINKGDKTCSYL